MTPEHNKANKNSLLTDTCMEYNQQEKILKFLKGKNLIVVSNRGPVEFKRINDEIKMKRGAGGLVSTLMPLVEALNGVWVASAMTLEDAEVARRYPKHRVLIPEEDPKFKISFVVTDRDRYEDYYSVISNPLLWFIQHYMWNSPYTPDIDDHVHEAWKEGYIYLNQEFADKVIEEAKINKKEPLIMLQDYHLYLCPAYIREKMDDVFLTQFIHIPWPQADYFNILPDYMKKSIIDGLLSNNILGFHIPRYVDNFLHTCSAYVEEVDFEESIIYHKDHHTHVKSYPISVDYNSIKRMEHDSDVKKKEELIKRIKGDKFLFYRTDRADLSKNIIRGFKAYDLFLEKHPEYKTKVVFLATGKPTRQYIKNYIEYSEAVEEIIKHINSKHGKDGWKPIEYIFKADYNLVVAAFKNYDCLIVNPIADGMNIVPKEASVVNQTQGVVILSETAGSFEDLKEHIIGINPFDITQTARAYHDALEMSLDKRYEKWKALRELASKRTIYDWISEQFEDMEKIKK